MTMNTATNRRHSLKNSLKCAAAGIRALVLRERNARIHCAAACLAVAAGLWLGLSACEWAAIALAIGAVISAEAFNTAIEALCDRLIPGRDDDVKTVKDVAAGAALVAACAAVAVGLAVFLPKIIRFINNMPT